MNEEGKGVKQSSKKANEFYTKACDGGDAIGCFKLGLMYRKGEGVKQDHKKAKDFFSLAFDGGVQDGCENSAKLYRAGY